MVSKASEDLPEPLSPVITVRLLRGISTVMFFRLCWRAPRTVILLMATNDSSRLKVSLIPHKKNRPVRGAPTKVHPHRKARSCGGTTIQPYLNGQYSAWSIRATFTFAPFRAFKVAVGKILLHLPYYRRPCASGIFRRSTSGRILSTPLGRNGRRQSFIQAD